MPEQVQSCRSEEGITVGLVDALIVIMRVLAPRDLSTENVQHALADFFEDPDFRTVQNARQQPKRSTAMSLPSVSNLGALAKSAETYALDLAERTGATAIQAFVGAIVLSQPLDLSMWKAAAIAGVAAGAAVVKGAIARLFGDSNSASLVKGV